MPPRAGRPAPSGRRSARPALVALLAVLSLSLINVPLHHPSAPSPPNRSERAAAVPPGEPTLLAPIPAPATAYPRPASLVVINSAGASPSFGYEPLHVVLTATATGSSTTTNFTFNWTFGDGTPNVVQNATANSSHAGTDSVNHTYYLQSPNAAVNYTALANVSDNGGDKYQLTHKINVAVTPVLVALGVASPPVFTLGGLVELSPSVTGGMPPYKFVWSGTPPGCRVSSVDANCTVPSPGTWTPHLSVTDAVGNHASADVSFTANPTMVIFAGAQAYLICPNPTPTLQENFTANVTAGTPPYVYSWSFGDGSPGVNGSRLDHNYSVAGNYSARVTVNDSGGDSVNYTFKIAASFAACFATPPPVFGVPTLLVEGLIVIAFAVVIALTLAIAVQRWRAGRREGPRPLRESTSARPRTRPGSPPEPPPPEEGTIP